jgi:hypothetical protein
MSRTTKRRCRSCGEGTIVPTAAPGREWTYKRLTLVVPSDFEIPTCDHCGEEWLDANTANALDSVLAELYLDALRATFEKAIAVLTKHRSQRTLERLLGLSQGYISKLLSRTKTPSEALVTHVLTIAREPGVRLQELEDDWRSVPPAWLAKKLGDGAADGSEAG